MASAQRERPESWVGWKSTHRRWRAHVYSPEWALEWFVYWVRGLAFFDRLEIAGRLSIIVAVIFWFLEAGDRQKQKHYRAWELINAARGSTGDGGRLSALQDLNNDQVPLDAAPLANAWLHAVQLPTAQLSRADLTDAHLDGAQLFGAHLTRANLSGAELQGADLRFADLREARLSRANLSRANLYWAVLNGAVLGGANLSGANLSGANLLDWADLSGADLSGANLSAANLSRVTGLAQHQLDAACGDELIKLSPGLTIKPCQPAEGGDR